MFPALKVRLYHSRFRRFFSICSALLNEKKTCSDSANSIRDVLVEKIRANGPIPIADFMSVVHHYPAYGYFMKKNDNLSSTSDNALIKTPAMNKVFGEIIAFWFINEWLKVGAPLPFNVMELGPGTGILMRNLLSTFQRLKADKYINVYMMEISEHLAEIQAQNMGVVTEECDLCETCFQKGTTKNGIPVYWFRDFLNTPVRGFTFLIAQQFLSSLPVHRFKRTKAGWREIMVDVDDKSEAGFKFVTSKEITSATQRLISEHEKRNEIEICPDGLAFLEVMADRMDRYGGLTLFLDHGFEKSENSTLKSRKFVDSFLHLGDVNLTADVDFSLLKEYIGSNLISYGPIQQREFLKNMAIDRRLEKLLENSHENRKSSIQIDYDILMEDCGRNISPLQFISFFPSVLKQILKESPPAGFGENCP